MTRCGLSFVCALCLTFGGMAAAEPAKPAPAPAHPTSFDTLWGHVDIGGDQKRIVVTLTEADGASGRYIKTRRPGQGQEAYDPDAMAVLFLLGGVAHPHRPLPLFGN
jgi:hypothetical protein